MIKEEYEENVFTESEESFDEQSDFSEEYEEEEENDLEDRILEVHKRLNSNDATTEKLLFKTKKNINKEEDEEKKEKKKKRKLWKN